MKILGVYNGHTASACLLVDGKIVSAVSEERFTGVKNQIGFPRQSIKWVLESNGLKAKDLDYVAIPQNMTVPIYSPKEAKSKNISMILLSFISLPVNYFRKIIGRLSYHYKFLSKLRIAAYNTISKPIGKFSAEQEKKMIARELGVDIKKIISFDHHLSHAAAAYYTSPFIGEKALVLTADGEGDGLCASINIFEDNSYATISTTTKENSLAHIYMYLTAYLGMKMVEHEYKVMGLAPYAKVENVDKIYKKIKDIIVLDPDDKLKFKMKFHASQTLQFLEKEMKGLRFDNIAGAFQRLVEVRVEEWVREAIKKTGIRTLCLSGGLFMNVKLNKVILEMPEVERLYVLPSCGDETSIFGAAALTEIAKSADLGKKAKFSKLESMLVGPSFSLSDVEKFIVEASVKDKYKVQYFTDIEKEIARLLSQNKVVARMSGGGEFGARALGHRSIMANPSDRDVVMIINEQMKDRDFWMPFAASILEERQHDYMDNPKNFAANFMIMAFESTPLARKELFAGLHPYDFTCRPQIVVKENHPKYHRIIKEFEALTGIGGILNTSFNLHGFPIVLGPKEAYHAFEHSGLEYMALENYLISKEL